MSAVFQVVYVADGWVVGVKAAITWRQGIQRWKERKRVYADKFGAGGSRRFCSLFLFGLVALCVDLVALLILMQI